MSVGAALSGNTDIAVGNVVGSNIFNVLVVLGMSALVVPLRVKSRLVKRDVPLLLGVSMAVWGMASGGRLTWQAGVALLTATVMNIIGDVSGRHCILIDDIIDSGGTLCNAAEALLEGGAKSVAAYITHGVLSGGAVARINGSALKELVITDSIRPTEAAAASDRIRVLPIAPLVGEAIRRIADESSVSSLFD